MIPADMGLEFVQKIGRIMPMSEAFWTTAGARLIVLELLLPV